MLALLSRDQFTKWHLNRMVRGTQRRNEISFWAWEAGGENVCSMCSLFGKQRMVCLSLVLTWISVAYFPSEPPRYKDRVGPTLSQERRGNPPGELQASHLRNVNRDETAEPARARQCSPLPMCGSVVEPSMLRNAGWESLQSAQWMGFLHTLKWLAVYFFFFLHKALNTCIMIVSVL